MNPSSLIPSVPLSTVASDLLFATVQHIPFKHGSAVRLLTIDTDMIRPVLKYLNRPFLTGRSSRNQAIEREQVLSSFDETEKNGCIWTLWVIGGCIEIGVGVKRRRARSPEQDKREQLPT